MYYKGYVVKLNPVDSACGCWIFYVTRPNGQFMSNTIFFEPGRAWMSPALRLASAERQVRRAIRRDRRMWNF